ncbi:MarR family winged helix-turn-helix transcriptional regulator [Microbacterium sp. AK031]|uniref:MarR family winged helix-turn-helix transcriptional regulator n=1 Tax=Microbacterium sp. AK031 TaxID=2723076 RepID=UPI002169DA06|nr:hypothetical protein [Microbacterium sp. AK031]MCS3844288.1 hypothetical protein [Microbacterium sp. AK031]
MNTINTDETSRPFGFWLKAVDRLMAAEFASAFESEGITRREWRLLNIVDGSVPAGRPKSDHPLPAHKLARLIELGWVTDADGTWTLTDDGRAAKERLGGIVDGIRAKVTDAVPAEDLATTMATLERLARTFGWDEETPLPRGRGRRGFGDHGFGHRSFGPRGSGRRGHGFRHPSQRFDHEGYERHDGHGAPGTSEREDCHHGGPHGHRGGHARARFAHFAQGAYERGFDAGFTRGRDDR